MTISLSIRFWLLLVPLIPSLIVTIFNLYYFLCNRALRIVLNNHVIIILLFYGLIEEITDISWQIHFYRTGNVLSSTPAFCLTYVFVGPYLTTSLKMLMGWASIERHILVFHRNWFGTKKKRVLFHYFPLFMCMIWPMIFYFVIFIILPCSIPFNYNIYQCNRYGCLLGNPAIQLVDSIVNYIMSPFIIVIFSVTLLVRVLYHRHRINQRIDWRNYRKMIVQLLALSFLYLVFQLPQVIMYVAYSAGLSRSIGGSYYSDSFFLIYYVTLLTPFVTVMSLPDLQTKCRNVILFWQRRRVVPPEMIIMKRRNALQTDALAPVTP
ncbi:unnamed protein product [Adineta steineri]|uniref:G-protein coupled receptors family 1 profile domain-containing protein n=1 Tax=Adineta steineri TaxID=433720 RepID=A0A819JT65_9BILA|nr:unnamed protein product [Adineta steineri]